MNNKEKFLHIRVDDSFNEQIQKIAKASGMTKSDFIRKAIEDAIIRKIKKDMLEIEKNY